ncbi:hypothetical protein [Fibrella aquatilis]|uniref:Uncharacterized protein n=1 Tax=Fibrella aquatilis TaxID=2817059 RepID=A0A939GC25_9BACT|nr:hypothetical protein [Fibrella aquatilis]MBO0933936.1 hypothetical protein [Fibrella aquatilis]
MQTILDLPEKDRQSIYAAAQLIDDALDRNQMISLQTFISDSRHGSLISLTFHNSKHQKKRELSDVG